MFLNLLVWKNVSSGFFHIMAASSVDNGPLDDVILSALNTDPYMHGPGVWSQLELGQLNYNLAPQGATITIKFVDWDESIDLDDYDLWVRPGLA